MPNDASYYNDAPGGDAPEKTDSDKPDDSGAKTGLLPKSLFGHELRPGDKCDIEVVAVHEQDYAVKGCVGHDEGEKPEPEGGDESEPAAPPSEMSAMLSD